MPIDLDTLAVQVMAELQQFEAGLAATSFEALLERPPISDESLVKCVEVMGTLVPTAYLTKPADRARNRTGYRAHGCLRALQLFGLARQLSQRP